MEKPDAAEIVIEKLEEENHQLMIALCAIENSVDELKELVGRVLDPRIELLKKKPSRKGKA